MSIVNHHIEHPTQEANEIINTLSKKRQDMNKLKFYICKVRRGLSRNTSIEYKVNKIPISFVTLTFNKLLNSM